MAAGNNGAMDFALNTHSAGQLARRQPTMPLDGGIAKRICDAVPIDRLRHGALERIRYRGTLLYA